MFCLASCGKVNESSGSTEEEELPDMIMTDASYTFGESGRRPVIMSASKITIYSSKADKTVLVDIKFQQEDENKEIEMEGRCNYAVVTENNSKAELHGDIHLFKKTDNFSIICNDLIWDNDKQTIHTSGVVSVVYEDNTKMRARGFSAQLDENIYEFETILEGSYNN